MVNGAGTGNCWRIDNHPPVDRYRLAQRPLCLCRDGKEEVGREVLKITLPGRPPTVFASADFLPTTGSPGRAIRPSSCPAPLVFLPSPGAIGGTGL